MVFRPEARLSLRWAVLGLIVLIMTAGTGCTDLGEPPVPDESGAPEVHTVTRGSISSVVTLDAQVESGPEVLVGAPESGSDYEQTNPVGDVVKAGDALAEYKSGDSTKTITLPVEVDVVEVHVSDGASFEKSATLMTVRLHRLAVVGSGDASTLYRLSQHSSEAKAQITDGPGPFDCRMVGQIGLTDEQVTAACVPDDPDLDLYPGLAGLVAVQVGGRDDVLTLPLEAVAGAADHGVVNRLVGDEVERVDVELGLSDGARVEITSGLEEGDIVSAVPPSLSPPQGPR